MRLLDSFTPETTMAAVEEKLRADGIEYEVEESEFSDGPELELERDGWKCMICFDATSKCVTSRGGWRTLPIADGLALVAEAVRADTMREPRRLPKEAVASISETQRLMQPARDVQLSWATPERIIVLSISEGDANAHLRFDVQAERARTPRVAVSLYQARLREVAHLIEAAPTVSGERGHAVTRLRDQLRSRYAVLAKYAEVVASATPEASLYGDSLERLANHAVMLVAHERLFTGDDDWRDALVIVDDGDVCFDDGLNFGWQVSWAGLGISGPFDLERRVVRLVEGPFAYGVHRVFRAAHELHAIRDGWPVHEVVTGDPVDTLGDPHAVWKRGIDPAWLADVDPQWMMEMGACVASRRDSFVLLRGMGSPGIERIATLLLCARS